MALYREVHPTHPQERVIQEAVDILRGGGVIVYPTDSTYALGCSMGDKKALDRIRSIRHLEEHHPFTLVCRDLSDLGTYARVSNPSYRILKALTPGPFTFILEGTKEVPRRLLDKKRKTIGLRVPDHEVVQMLLNVLGEPLMSSTLVIPGDEFPLCDPEEIRNRLSHGVDFILNGGACGLEPTTLIDLTGEKAQLLRQGKGDASDFFSV